MQDGLDISLVTVEELLMDRGVPESVLHQAQVLDWPVKAPRGPASLPTAEELVASAKDTRLGQQMLG